MSDEHARQLLQERIAAVEERIARACLRASRPRGSVTLVAVTKTISAATARLLPEFGLCDLGENRPQALWAKAAALPNHVHWHMIGHLQRNKIERTLPLTHLIHAVDSIRLLEALEQEAARRSVTIDVMLEFNLSREASKHGFAPSDCPQVQKSLHALQRVNVRGVMTMAAPAEDPEQARPTFAELRQVRERLHDPDFTAPHDFAYLSMGMSGDFEVAIEEGATHVRLGSVLFEGLP